MNTRPHEAAEIQRFHVNLQGVMTQILGGFQILHILMLAASSACTASKEKTKGEPELFRFAMPGSWTASPARSG